MEICSEKAINYSNNPATVSVLGLWYVYKLFAMLIGTASPALRIVADTGIVAKAGAV
jgi:hypothetical protein